MKHRRSSTIPPCVPTAVWEITTRRLIHEFLNEFVFCLCATWSVCCSSLWIPLLVALSHAPVTFLFESNSQKNEIDLCLFIRVFVQPTTASVHRLNVQSQSSVSRDSFTFRWDLLRKSSLGWHGHLRLQILFLITRIRSTTWPFEWWWWWWWQYSNLVSASEHPETRPNFFETCFPMLE